MSAGLANHGELRELLTQLAVNELDVHGERRLNEVLKHDAAARDFYRRFQLVDALLQWEYAEPERADMQPESRLARAWDAVVDVANNYIVLSALISGLVITTILLLLALWIVPDWRPGAPVAQQPSTRFVARIANTSEASFDQASDANFKNRDLFDDDKIVLKSGLAVIEYDTGARVVLEGPATYHVQGANGGDLRQGMLVARVDTDDARGFAVSIPGARIVDLGTEFGVTVGSDGSSEIAVLSGEVELVGTATEGRPGQRIRLAANQAATVATDSGRISTQVEDNPRLLGVLRSRRSMLHDQQTAPATGNVEAAFVVYHDFGGEPSPGYITTQRSLEETISLLGHADGHETGIELSITGANNIDVRSAGETRPPAPGTPAAQLFDDSGLDLHSGTLNVGGNHPTKSMTLTLNGLEPGRRYDLALYGDRAAPADGVERFTLQGATAATNRSSTGVIDRFTTDMETRPNAPTGHVVRWTDVAVDEHGKLAVRIDADVSSRVNIAYLSALRLARQETVQTNPTTRLRNQETQEIHE